jgi:hypothetical protein
MDLPQWIEKANICFVAVLTAGMHLDGRKKTVADRLQQLPSSG